MARPTQRRRAVTTGRRAGAKTAQIDASSATLWERLPNWGQHLLCIGALLLVTLAFWAPAQFGTKTLMGGDIVQWRGAAQAMLDYEDQTGKDALWAPNIFGGMPGYMVHYAQKVPQVDSLLREMRRIGLWPTAHFFALLLGVYLLLVYLVGDKLAGVGGALAYGLTTYIPIIMVAGAQYQVYRPGDGSVAAASIRLPRSAG